MFPNVLLHMNCKHLPSIVLYNHEHDVHSYPSVDPQVADLKGEPLLTKALRIINEYERFKNYHTFTTTSSTLPTRTPKNFTTFEHVKVRLLPNCFTYYQMPLTPFIAHKMAIHHFRGGPILVYVYYDKLGT
jgi:hypothetical protein